MIVALKCKQKATALYSPHHKCKAAVGTVSWTDSLLTNTPGRGNGRQIVTAQPCSQYTLRSDQILFTSNLRWRWITGWEINLQYETKTVSGHALWTKWQGLHPVQRLSSQLLPLFLSPLAARGSPWWQIKQNGGQCMTTMCFNSVLPRFLYSSN